MEKKTLKSLLAKLEHIEENNLGQLQGGFFSVAYVSFSGTSDPVNNCKGGTCTTNNCTGGNCVPGCGKTQ